VPRVTRAAFYWWFDEPLEHFHGVLAQRALGMLGAAGRSAEPLSGVKDWYIVDSTTTKVRDALSKDFPGTGDYAALKCIPVLSVAAGSGALPLQPARGHDSSASADRRALAGLWAARRPGIRQSGRLQACDTTTCAS